MLVCQLVVITLVNFSTGRVLNYFLRDSHVFCGFLATINPSHQNILLFAISLERSILSLLMLLL